MFLNFIYFYIKFIIFFSLIIIIFLKTVKYLIKLRFNNYIPPERSARRSII